MPIENNTLNQEYPLPNAANFLSDDVLRLIAALQGVDADAATLFASLAGKAEAVHGHDMTAISGLAAALDAKAAVTHSHSISDVSGLQTALDAKAPLASPAFTGTPTVPTQLAADSSSRIANTAYVKSQTLTFTGGVTGSGNIGGSITMTLADAIVTMAKMAASAIATTAEFLSGAAKLLTAERVWASATPVVVPYAATINFNFSTFIHAAVTMTGNVTLGEPVGTPRPGQSGMLEFTHSGGARTLSFSSTYYQAKDGAITLEGTAGQIEKVAYYVAANGKVELSLVGVAT